MSKYMLNRVPKLVAILELNKKFGYGYQARLIMEGIIDSVIDAEPFTLDDAYSGAVYAIEEINKETGYGYDPYEIINITSEAVTSNKKHDFTSARVARDIQRGSGELAVPVGVDCTKKVVDGKEETLLSGRGVVLMIYFAWKDDKLPKARKALYGYCYYLAMHGFGTAASEIFTELERKNKHDGANWIKASYGKYVKDDIGIINFVMNIQG